MQRRVFALLLAGLTGAAVLGCVKNSSAPVVAGELKPLTVDQVATRLAANDGKTFIYDNNPKESLEALIDEELAKANQRILAGTPNGAYYRTWVLGKGLTKIERAAATTPPGS